MTEFSDTGTRPLNLQEARDGIRLRLRSLQLICADNNTITSPRALGALLSLGTYTCMCNYSLKTDYVRNDPSALFDGYYIESFPRSIENNRWFFFKPEALKESAVVWIGYRNDTDIFTPETTTLASDAGLSRRVLLGTGWHIRPDIVSYPTKQDLCNASR